MERRVLRGMASAWQSLQKELEMPDDPNSRGSQDRKRESQQELDRRYREEKRKRQSNQRANQKCSSCVEHGKRSSGRA